MSDNEENNRRGNSLGVWLSTFVMLPVVYVLLSGPAVWLFHHGYGEHALPFIYTPLIWLEMSGTSLGRLLSWYWAFWKG